MVQGRELSEADITTMSGRAYEVALDGLVLSGVSSVALGPIISGFIRLHENDQISGLTGVGLRAFLKGPAKLSTPPSWSVLHRTGRQ